MASRRTSHPHIRSYKRGGAIFWKVTFALLGVQVRRQSFSSADAAEEFYHSARKSIREGTWVRASGTQLDSMNLNELYQMYCNKIGNSRSDATIKNGAMVWRTHIRLILGSKKPRAITKRALALWTDSLRDKGLSDNSIKVVRAELSNVLRMACDYELLDTIPAFPKLTPKPKRKELFSPSEIQQILRGFKDNQYRLMALVQYQLGLRINEMLALRHGAIDLDNRTVLIDCQVGRHTKGLNWEDRLKPVKNRIVRALPIGRDLAEALKAHLESRNSGGPLWVSSRGTPVSESSYSRALKLAAIEAGITRPISSHSVRASCLNYLVNDSGLPVSAVAWFGRHEAAVLLARYSRPEKHKVFEYFGTNSAPELATNCEFLAITDKDKP